MAWGLAVTGWVAITLLMNDYEASAQIHVGVESQMHAFGSKYLAVHQHFTATDMAGQSLLDSARLEYVARAAGPIRENQSGDGRSKILDRIEIEAVGRWDNLYRISFVDADRRKAVSVVRSFLDEIAASGIGDGEIPVEKLLQNERSAAEAGFRIVEPPTAKTAYPASSHLLWATLIFLVSVAAGVGIARLQSIRSPVFHDRASLSQITGLPVISVVSHAWLAQEHAQRRREIILFGIATVLLLIGFAVVLLIPTLTNVI